MTRRILLGVLGVMALSAVRAGSGAASGRALALAARPEHEGVGGNATAPVGFEDPREIDAQRVIGPHRR